MDQPIFKYIYIYIYIHSPLWGAPWRQIQRSMKKSRTDWQRQAVHFADSMNANRYVKKGAKIQLVLELNRTWLFSAEVPRKLWGCHAWSRRVLVLVGWSVTTGICEGNMPQRGGGHINCVVIYFDPKKKSFTADLYPSAPCTGSSKEFDPLFLNPLFILGNKKVTDHIL